MDPSDSAKYLNSPETELFDKSRALFNHGPARAAAGQGQPLIVAEGYMDVIALSEAGFTAAVAPLGTAVTEHQLALLWRIADEPVMALDGDTAGIRAAMRLIDVALPRLEAGKSLRFALLPGGQDPDDLIRSAGPAAMREVIDRARPMVSLLWEQETEGRVFDSPERRAALDKALRTRIRAIADPSIRRHYGDEIQRLRQELFGQGRRPAGPAGAGAGGWQRQRPRPGPTPRAKASVLAGPDGAEDRLREAAILALLVSHPDMVARFAARIEAMECTDPDHAALRAVVLARADTIDLRAAIAAELGADVLEKLFGHAHVAIIPAVRRPGSPEVAELCLTEEFAKLEARRGHVREVAEAEEELADDGADEYLTARLAQSAEAIRSAGAAAREDRTNYETGPNGARVNRDERHAFDDLLARIGYRKPGQGGPGAS